jgi:hypothetical protein
MRLAVAALLLALPWLGCVAGEDMEKRVPVEPGGLLEVDLDRGVGLRPDEGSLVVHSHDADEVRVVVEASEWGASGVRFRVDRQGHTVRVIGRVGGAVSWLFGGPRVEVRVWVPREFALDLRTTGGDLRIAETAGRVRARTDDGSLEVARVEGEVRLRAIGDVRVTEVVGDLDVRIGEGDIEASFIEGDVELRTGGGEIDVSHVEGDVIARSERGGIRLEALRGEVDAVTERGNVYATFVGAPMGRVETSRGDIEVLLPDDVGVDLDAISRRGEVALAPGVSVPGEHTPDRVAGPLAGGGSTLRLFTARGTVNVRRR